MDAPGLGEIADLFPARDACDVDRLDGAPEPDDIEVVKALVIDVVGLGPDRGLALGADEIEVLEDQRDAEIGLGAQAHGFEQRDLGAEHAQDRPTLQMQRGRGMGLRLAVLR